MTAQTVIMNKLCVGVSSDSSVTLSGSDGTRRTFPTAEKIMPLPVPHNVVVLHSGSTELLSVPYSVLLGEWARTLPNSPLSRVADYRTHLEAWLLDQVGLFTQDAQDQYLKWILRDVFLAIRGRILQQCEARGIAETDWHSPVASAVFEECVDATHIHLSNQAKLPGWEGVDCGSLIQGHDDLVNEAREWVFDDTPRSEKGDAELSRLAATLLGVYEPFDRDAVLMFVGFGDDEIFPASEEATFQGIVDGRLRTAPPETTEITTDMNASIIP
jgi:hypothetical protein